MEITLKIILDVEYERQGYLIIVTDWNVRYGGELTELQRDCMKEIISNHFYSQNERYQVTFQ